MRVKQQRKTTIRGHLALGKLEIIIEKDGSIGMKLSGNVGDPVSLLERAKHFVLMAEHQATNESAIKKPTDKQVNKLVGVK